jgi:hypothetical protein
MGEARRYGGGDKRVKKKKINVQFSISNFQY